MIVDRDELIAEAERIGQRLLRSAIREDGLLSWRTGPRQTRSQSLYDGAAGIALFFMKLAEVTRKETYLDAATAAMQWSAVSLRDDSRLRYGFYTGRLGIAFAWLRLSRLSGLPCGAAVHELTRDAKDARQSHTADLLTGVAGTLLGLLHVHQATGDPALLETAGALVDDLIARAQPARAGLYWDRGSQQVRGLCGLSHGAAGVGWVLAELAGAVSNDAFSDLARQAFAYERDHFNPATGNWTDYRRNYIKPDDFAALERAYLRGDLAPFFARDDMNAWCHGAAGIGLSRLRAWELLGDDACRADLRLAVRRVIGDFDSGRRMPSATLCHGAFGNAALLFAAAPAIDFADCDAVVHRVVAQFIDAARSSGSYASGDVNDPSEDASLLMGSSGIGYFLLQLAIGERRDPLLLPSLHGAAIAPAVPALSVSVQEIRATIAAKHFPRLHTLGVEIDDRPRMFEAARQRHPEAADLIALEERRWSVTENASLALLGVRSIVHEQRVDEFLESAPLRLSSDAAIVTTRDEHEILLFATLDQAGEVPLQPLASAILAQFEEPCRVDDAIARLAEILDAEPDRIRSVAVAQVRAAVLQSILVPAW